MQFIEFKAEASPRRSLVSSELAGTAFQLLPRAHYPAGRLEKGLRWQEKFIAALPEHSKRKISLVAVCSSLAQAKTLAASLSVQSYRNFEVHFALTGGGEDLERIKAYCEQRSLSGSASVCARAELSAQHLVELSNRASGEYVMLLPPAMFLHPQALFAHLKSIIEHSPALIYSNEVTLIRSLQETKEYYRKSCGGKLSLLAMNPFGDGICIKRDMFAEIASSISTKICVEDLSWIIAAHVLQHNLPSRFIRLGLLCRDGSFASSLPWEDRSHSELFKSLTAYASAVGVEVKSLEAQPEQTLRPRLKDAPARVQVVIPFRDKPELMEGCLRSLSLQSAAKDLEITLVDNESSQRTVYEIDLQIKRFKNLNISIVPAVGYFNYAWLNNVGAAQRSAPFILLLNNDVELISEDTIAELLRWAACRDVGAVGGRLYYPDGDVQSAGINFGPARPVAVHLDNMFMNVAREVNAVTFAMALIKRSVFEQIGGLDEFRCPNGFGDALFCDSVQKAGYKVIYTPHASAIHYESRSRDLFPEELELMELFEQGVPISDLFSDFEAENQPTRVIFNVLDEPPVVKLAGRMAANPRVSSVANTLADGLISLNRVRRSVGTTFSSRIHRS
ncbi:MAG: glycosyltransferase [Bdellovibrionales bacterium]|nr:glycosyltransferase [Bdellovibrionales bacterium]